MIEGGVIIV